jgi:hypothetical protein
LRICIRLLPFGSGKSAELAGGWDAGDGLAVDFDPPHAESPKERAAMATGATAARKRDGVTR